MKDALADASAAMTMLRDAFEQARLNHNPDSEPVDPEEPIELAEPEGSVEPVESVDPVKPVDPEEEDFEAMAKAFAASLGIDPEPAKPDPVSRPTPAEPAKPPRMVARMCPDCKGSDPEVRTCGRCKGIGEVNMPVKDKRNKKRTWKKNSSGDWKPR